MNGAVSTTAWALHRLRGFCPGLLTYALIYTLGYTATAWIIGRQTERGPGAAGESSTMGTAPPGKVGRRGRTGVHGSDAPCLVRGSRSSGEP